MPSIVRREKWETKSPPKRRSVRWREAPVSAAKWRSDSVPVGKEKKVEDGVGIIVEPGRAPRMQFEPPRIRNNLSGREGKKHEETKAIKRRERERLPRGAHAVLISSGQKGESCERKMKEPRQGPSDRKRRWQALLKRARIEPSLIYREEISARGRGEEKPMRFAKGAMMLRSWAFCDAQIHKGRPKRGQGEVRKSGLVR